MSFHIVTLLRGLGMGLTCAASLQGQARPATGASADSSALALARDRVRRAMDEYTRRVAEARSNLAKGEAIRADATSKGEAGRAATAAEAIDNARKSIDEATRLRSIDSSRLAAIDRASAWPAASRNTAAAPLIVSGTVRVHGSGSPHVLDPRRPIRSGDTLDVGADGFVELLLPDGAATSLGPGTTYLIREATRRRSVADLLHGVMHTSETCARDSGTGSCPVFRTLRVHTPATVVIGVRGTEFVVRDSTDGATVTVLDGEIAISAKDSGTEVVLRKAQLIELSNDGNAGTPIDVDIETMRRWWEREP